MDASAKFTTDDPNAYELDGKEVSFGCFTPQETRLSHALQTAALVFHRKQAVAEIKR